MNNLSRYMRVLALQTNDNTLIPIWDPALRFKDRDEDYSPECKYPNQLHGLSHVVEAIWDMQEKLLLPGISIELFNPEISGFKVNQEVFYEVPRKHRVLRASKIIKIEKGRERLEIIKGKDLKGYQVPNLQLEIDPDALYALRTFDPKYILEDGTEIEWDHQLFSKG